MSKVEKWDSYCCQRGDIKFFLFPFHKHSHSRKVCQHQKLDYIVIYKFVKQMYLYIVNRYSYCWHANRPGYIINSNAVLMLTMALAMDTTIAMNPFNGIHVSVAHLNTTWSAKIVEYYFAIPIKVKLCVSCWIWRKHNNYGRYFLSKCIACDQNGSL